ncbi:TetR/AcrR family transcriptional regulator [Pseudonocardia aurantiaca]|uniref:TetR/AcrR family transcriptional regulator n=1 Tax=Pseudonocardia aurantiaca TaxID=75290 RepID=A0ABW4FGL4_9PSEU
MSVQQRRERERARRHDLIVSAARELAEAEGWDAVTTRRLSEKIEYSQPVLYSHFSGKDAIAAAVALEGFAELADALASARTGAGAPREALARVFAAYAAFAYANPALYDAMFTLATDLPFAQPTTPAPLQAAFTQFYEVLAPLVGDREAGTFTEVAWSALHGLVTLERGGRLSVGRRDERLELLVEQFLIPLG